MWNAIEHTIDENARWSWLRAIEWQQWPLFVLQPIVPLSLFFVPWKAALATPVVATWAWALVRRRFISVHLAYVGWIFVWLKWPSAIVCGAILYLRQDYGLAALAAGWPLATLILTQCCPLV